MITIIRAWITRRRRCVFHDRPPTPLQIARLEEATGIRPGAVADLWASSDGIPDHYDPDLIECGLQWCRRKRGLA